MGKEVEMMKNEILSNLIINKVCYAATMYNDAGSFAERESRAFWGIVLKYEGETIYTQGEKTYFSDKCNMVILPKGAAYKWHCNKAGHFSIVEFDSDFTGDEIYTFPVMDWERTLKSLKNIEYRKTLKKPMFEMECIRDCYSLIIELVKSWEKKYLPSERNEKIAPAMEFVAKNYTKQIKNSFLAEICGLSEVYFRKLFTEINGISPISYVKQLRIKKAKEMLESDHGSITDIAYSLGYLNIYDFSRSFKKSEGVASSDFAKRLMKK